MTGFFFGFGWGGAIAMNAGLSVIRAFGVGLGCGFCLLMATFGLIKTLSRIHTDGNIKLKNAVGQTGTVYLTIPPQGQGSGQIQVLVQGQMITVSAMNQSVQEIQNTQKVRVISALDESTVLVEPLSPAVPSPQPPQ